MIVTPGKSVLAMGPSGTGKSTLAASTVRHHGSGVIVTAPGADEVESYAEFFDIAEHPTWDEKGNVTIPGDARVVIASFDDPDFSTATKDYEAEGLRRLIFFLRAIRQIVQEDVNAGKPPRWGVLVEDTWSGIGTLAINAMLAQMKLQEPPPAMSPDGSKYYGGLATRMNDAARASRVLKGLGMDWVATSHVKYTEPSEAAKPSTKTSVNRKQQYMPLLSGSFREGFSGIFDMVFHAEVVARGEYKMLFEADLNRQPKVRGLKRPLLPEGSYIDNDWPTVLAAYEAASK